MSLANTRTIVHSFFDNTGFDYTNWIDTNADPQALFIGCMLFRGNDGNWANDLLFGRFPNDIRQYQTVADYFTTGSGTEIGSDSGSNPDSGVGDAGGYQRVAVRCDTKPDFQATNEYRWSIAVNEINFGTLNYTPQQTISGCLWYGRLGSDGANSGNIVDSAFDSSHIPFKFEGFATPDQTAGGPVKVVLPANNVLFTMSQSA